PRPAGGADQRATKGAALLRPARRRLGELRGVRIIGTAPQRAGVLSFAVDAPPLSALDVGTKLDLEGVAVRTGHHCCQPVMERFGVSGTARASFALYNTLAEVDHFADTLKRILTEARAKARPLTVLSNRPEPAYPPASAPSPARAASEIAGVFGFLEDWPERYQHLIELGEKLPPMPDDLKVDCNRVRGCQSTVFMAARQKPGTADVIEFLADSDAHIVRGELGLLQHLF